jgi:Ca2+-binding RTX toxin-like protein
VRTLAASLVVVCALVTPAAALADGDISIIEDRMLVSWADNTAANALIAFNPNGDRNYLVDEDAVMTPHAPCAVFGAPANRDWECPGGGLYFITLAGGAKRDQISLGGGVTLDATAVGEGGNDDLFMADGDDQLAGNSGSDNLGGGSGDDLITDGNPTDFGGTGGNDAFVGGNGNDVLDAGELRLNGDSGSGGDSLDGGPDFDTVDYSKRFQPVTVTEDGAPNDDQTLNGTSEGDNVTAAERVLGGSAGDRITGGPEGNVLEGRRGNDVLAGGLGDDTLAGGPGDDTASYAERSARVTVTLDDLPNDGAQGEHDDVAASTENVVGGSAGDSLTGGSGANVLVGGGGPDAVSALGGDDWLMGGAAADALAAGSGDDLIDARDGGADILGCGTGVDAVLGDLPDVVPPDCESAKVGGKALGRLKLGSTAVYAGGKLTVKVACPKGPFARCGAGRLSVMDTGKQLGTATFTIAAGKTASVKVAIPAAKLGARSSVTARAVARGAIGASRRVAVKR